MNRDEAFKILNKYVKEDFYIKHSEVVEAIMGKLASKLASTEIEQ